MINDEMICVAAYRTIDCVKRDGSSYPVAVHIGAPFTLQNSPDRLWGCKYRVERPGFAVNKLVAGEDSIHALYTALVLSGNELEMLLQAGTLHLTPTEWQTIGFPIVHKRGQVSPDSDYVEAIYEHASVQLPKDMHAALAGTWSAACGDGAADSIVPIDGFDDDKIKKVHRFGVPLASRVFNCVDHHLRSFNVRFSIAFTEYYTRGKYWRCSYMLCSKNSVEVRWSGGEDALQALVLAMRIAPTEISCRLTGTHAAFLNYGQIDDFGFPGIHTD